MNPFLKRLSLLMLPVLMTAMDSGLMAQNTFSLKTFGYARTESQLSYNFFLGPDAADFATSMNGFGSGILDPFGMRTSVDILDIGTPKVFLSLGAGFSVQKFRLASNLVFGKDAENVTTWSTDPNENHDYVNTFFGYGKSKIITTSFYFPADLNFRPNEHLLVSIGGYLDANLTARYKIKYLNGEEKVKEIIRSADFRTFHPSTIKYGVNFALFFDKIGYGISGTYSLTPFFKPGLGPDIHEGRVTITYQFLDLDEMRKVKEQKETE